MASFNYDPIEKQFEQLLTTVTGTFTNAELKEVRDFLEVGEYGLALQTFIDIVKEESKRIPIGACSTVRELATLMDLSDEIDMKIFLR